MESLRCKYEEQCRELNMDRDTEENAWKKFIEVSQRFILDGDTTHWFCCALYASCRESFTRTVGNALVMGNCVSLTKLLRCCNISIYEFLSKIKKWHDMANLSEDFKKQIETLERNFSLTYFLCQHYTKTFQDIFLTTNFDKKNTKFRSAVSKCSYQKLCDFAWCLFLCAKNECTAEELDLETSFYLLICCLDLIYKNVIYENRIDLINPKFQNVPEQLSVKIDPCIVDELAGLVNVAAKDANNFKQTKWLNILDQLFDAHNLYGNRQTRLELLSNHNFERSWKSLNAAYEQYILGNGAFDERILLNNQSIQQSLSTLESSGIGGDCGGGGVGFENNDYSKSILSLSPEQSQKLITIPDMDAAGDKLKKLLEVTLSAQPIGILCNVSNAVIHKINNKLDDMSTELRLKLGNKLHGTDVVGIIKPLYFHLLEKIIRVEVNNKPYINIETFLETDAFNTTLFVCCVEIVLNAYNCELKFPWTLECFKIDGFIFSKIIELVVARHDNILNRLHVKHLNYIEECCLESLSWRSTSKIWEILKPISNGASFPAWADVDKNSVANKDNNLNLPTPPAAAAYTASTTTCETARKDLFNAAAAAKASDNAAAATATDATSTTTSKINVDEIKQEQTQTPTPQTNHQCRKTASLKIFLRKFYKLAWQRLKELCRELNMQSDAYINKIWTLFEYSITQRTHLLRNRHLDQLIMCAIYIYIRVAEVESNKFTDIMKAYRKQPQAVSTTYREVLIQCNENTNTPEYNDLIFFYNKIYVPEMTPYALDFSKKRVRHSKLLMSPHPSERHSLPKKIFNNHKIFVSPMEKSDILQLSPDPLIYGIGKSPAKELQMMNDVVRRGKRNLPFNDDYYGSESPEAKYAPAHLNTVAVVMKDRRAESFST